jgi:hypothetical protein
MSELEWIRSETSPDLLGLARAYLLAKQRVIGSGFEHEIAWQETVSAENVTPTFFVREAAWVVLCAGMRESVIRGRFVRLGDAFENWVPQRIAGNRRGCRARALRVFNHVAKIDAIVNIAVAVQDEGVDVFLHGIDEHGPAFLTRLPFIGDVTCYHLAKNLGFATAKPDRHLQRIAAAFGFPGAQQLCEALAEVLAEPVQVVDIVLWRFATIEHSYVSWLERAIDAGTTTKRFDKMREDE